MPDCAQNGSQCGRARLSSVSLTGNSSLLAVNSTQQFRLVGTYEDGSTDDLTKQATWSTQAITGHASIPSFGLVDATNGLAGKILVMASVDGLSATAPLQLTRTITTAVGQRFGYQGNGGPALNAALISVQSVAFDPSNNLYILDYDSNTVRKIDAVSQTISTIAGNGVDGTGGDGGSAQNAMISAPFQIATDSAGNIYIADQGNNSIRKVSPDGTISSVAGNGSPGSGGDGGPATSAQLLSPLAVATDPSGNIYIGDSYNRAIRKVDAVTGIITKLADFTNGIRVTWSMTYSSGFVYVVAPSAAKVLKVDATAGTVTTFAGTGGICGSGTGDGGPATAACLVSPLGLGADPAGNIYIADTTDQVVRKVDASTGFISRFAGNGTAGYFGDGGAATAAKLNNPGSVTSDSAGNIYIGDRGNFVVRRVDASTKIISTVAGNGSSVNYGEGGPATSAFLTRPQGIAKDSVGNIYIADNSQLTVRKVSSATGFINVVAGNGTSGNSGDGGLATAAQFNAPDGVALDSHDNLYVSDNQAHVLREITVSNGKIATIAGTGSCAGTGDGGLASAAALCYPAGIFIDDSDNIYIADSGNKKIRRIDHASGFISTVAGTGVSGYSGDGALATAATLNAPESVWVDKSQNLFIADTGNNVIRKVVVATGIISTVAGNGNAGYAGDGGPATLAEFSFPRYLTGDSEGNLFICDYSNRVIRQLTAATGFISTLVGTSQNGYSGDGGVSTLAALNMCTGLVVDTSGNLYFGDEGTHTLRKLQ